MDAAFAWADEAPDPATPERPELRQGPFRVWAENWDTVALFWRLRRCWRYRPEGQVIGMDWTQVKHKLDLLGLRRKRMRRETERLERMEEAILGVIA